MPTVAVDKAALFAELVGNWTTESFDELCFEFGIELDEDTSQTSRPKVNGVEEPPQLKIDIPANRYDMLCFEGIALNLKVFLGQMQLPNFKLAAPANGEIHTMTVKEETMRIRPLVSCSVLRNVKFTQARYDSFIALQDKLHSNLARQRSLVSIGTHDLAKIKGPFTYDALPPEKISFVPLNQTRKMDGNELMEHYTTDKNLSKFLPLIRDSPVYPIIYDSEGTVLSLPPIINGDHSKITLDTRDVFIEITATDATKVEIVNHMMVAMFSRYCEDSPFTAEPVKIMSKHNGQSRETPDLTPREMQAEVSYLNDVTGLNLTPDELAKLLTKMGYQARPSATAAAAASSTHLDVSVPVTRADVLHQCDIMEDIAISYGFNRLPRHYPNKSASVAAALPLNKLTDVVRLEAAMAGWTEAMPLILCSHDENFALLNRPDDGSTAVRLANPKTAEYQVVRTSLLPGLLKTLRENKHRPVPIKVFEAADVVFKAPDRERRSRQERHFAACWYAKSSGFEVVHGLLDRLMQMLKCKFLATASATEKGDGYWIEQREDATFFAGYAASVMVRMEGKTKNVGSLGVLHPTVLKNFELPHPVSALEINLEVFL